MKKLLAITLLISLLQSDVMADFSRSEAVLHPQYPSSDPFIIEMQGTWPNDCHPGEQKPVVTNFDGHSIAIEFEIIVVHVTCNDKDTPYRVLVDMSEVLRATPVAGDVLELQASYDGDTLVQLLPLACMEDSNCETQGTNYPQAEPGLYFVPGWKNQGLLIDRQDHFMSIIPLVYDESGHSEWLFSGSPLVEDSFFAEVLHLSGGDCYGCEASGKTPEITSIGHLTVLVDQPGLMQVKLDDGEFTPYQRFVSGYEIFHFGPSQQQTLVDLEGRWGISENRGDQPGLGDLTKFLPGAFDLTLEVTEEAVGGDATAEQLSYLATTLSGQSFGQVVCSGQISADGSNSVCEFIDFTDVAEPLFLFHQAGPSSLSIEYGRSTSDAGTPPGGKAVRLD